MCMTAVITLSLPLSRSLCMAWREISLFLSISSENLLLPPFSLRKPFGGIGGRVFDWANHTHTRRFTSIPRMVDVTPMERLKQARQARKVKKGPIACLKARNETCGVRPALACVPFHFPSFQIFMRLKELLFTRNWNCTSTKSSKNRRLVQSLGYQYSETGTTIWKHQLSCATKPVWQP